MASAENHFAADVFERSRATLASVAASIRVSHELLMRSRRHLHESRALLAHFDARTARDVLPAMSLGDFFAGCIEKPEPPDRGRRGLAEGLSAWTARASGLRFRA